MIETTKQSATDNGTKILRFLVLATAILVYLLIVAGGIVSVTGSGGACPDWPTCLGSWTPPAELSARIDYAHRFLTFLTVTFVLSSAFVAWKHTRKGTLQVAKRF
jgi:heme A synthase